MTAVEQQIALQPSNQTKESAARTSSKECRWVIRKLRLAVERDLVFLCDKSGTAHWSSEGAQYSVQNRLDQRYNGRLV